MICIAA